MGKIGINQRQVKTTNQSLIVKEVRGTGQISRSMLAKKLKLSAPSISNNIDDLISRNIIFEIGIGKSNYGRKPINLQFNNAYGYVVAVDMISNVIRIAVSDLSGINILGEDVIDDALIITEEVIDKTILAISRMIAKAKLNIENLLCICIGSPGVIDPETNEIILCPRMRDGKMIHFLDMFNKSFSTKVIVKNDVNCATIGEHLFGSGKEMKNFINVYIDIGTGSGIFLNDRVFEGSRGGSGEFGLWVMNISEAVKENRVLLTNVVDNHISIFGLVCKIKTQHPDLFSHLGEGEINMHVMPEYTKALFDAVSNGDPRIITLVLKSAVELACVIKNICEFLDINCVILGGKVLNFGEIYMRTLRSFLKNNSSHDITIITSELGEKAVLYGALGEGINYVINDLIM